MKCPVYYLSEGEHCGLMEFEELAANLRLTGGDENDWNVLAGFFSVEDMINDIAGAINWPVAQGFWHGRIGSCNVCIVYSPFLTNLRARSKLGKG